MSYSRFLEYLDMGRVKKVRSTMTLGSITCQLPDLNYNSCK